LLITVAPNCVIVEEAAEILEAHVLTTIFGSVKRVVLIGDHMQLRPKLEHYSLRHDSGQHVDFDVSLLERLVKQPEGFPFIILNIQHRMRPEISSLIRCMTYPDLEDHPSVLNRDHIRGLASDVVFVTHNHPESSDDDLLALGTNSKVNLYEVQMVINTVQYFLQQFYQPSEIVILTPYLGQLVAIRDALAKCHLKTELGDLDKGDLVMAQVGLTPAHASGKESSSEEADLQESSISTQGVRVATIDNFQGEESRIIIGSLVRSNDEGDIGFMSSRERVNVFCSRARDGFIIIGDSSTFRNARSANGRNLWCKLLDLLYNEGRIYSGLPIVCQWHGTRSRATTVFKYGVSDIFTARRM
jgi:superfamily I DNA and/or RNA helicase